jgi:hypothetical protein
MYNEGKHDDRNLLQHLNTVLCKVKNALPSAYHAISSQRELRYLQCTLNWNMR